MNLKTAFEKLIYSKEYSEKARRPNKYMVYRTRYAAGEIGDGAMAKVLQEFGYEIRANGKIIDQAIEEILRRPDYPARFHSMAKTNFLRGNLRIGGKIKILKQFKYDITVENCSKKSRSQIFR